MIERRWGESSVLRRAAYAALAHLEKHGIDAGSVHLHGQDLVKDSDTPCFVGFQWCYADTIHQCLTHWGGVQWLEVPHPARAGAITAVLIETADRDALTAQQPRW